MASFFSKERTTAGPQFNRWLVPPAALAAHLCIGQVYAFSVFNEPLTRAIGIGASAPDDWKLTQHHPRKHRQAQIEGAGIQRVDRLLQIDAKCFPGIETTGDADERLGKVGVDTPVAQ